MKLALVHDFLNQFGGAERVVLAMQEIFPDAPLYTSIYDKKGMPEEFAKRDIRTTFMQYLPGVMKHYKKYLPFYPRAFESMKIKGYDVILSSSSSFAKGVNKDEGTLHICYCHNPMRFVWRYEDYIKEEPLSPIVKKLLPFYLNRLRMWDVATSSRVDHFIANSMTVARRILEHYGRDSDVINPPVETERFSISDEIDDYYLIVSRLKPYKKIEIAVEAFNKLKKPLKIAGSGDYSDKLRSIAGPTIEFLGRVSDEGIAKLYSRCRALIFPGEEDFGIVPVEAMASGRPVIAYGRGGAFETVKENETGVFFRERNADSLADAVKLFEEMSFDPAKIRDHARTFDKEVFKKKIKDYVEEKFKKR